MSVAELRLKRARAKRTRKLLEPRKVASWRRAVEQAALDTSDRPLPPVVRWRNAVLGPDGPRSPVTRALLIVLSTWMDKSGFAYPGYGQIAKRSRFDRRVVLRHIKFAEEECWIEITKVKTSTNRWNRNEYTACIPRFVSGDSKSPGGGDSDAPSW